MKYHIYYHKVDADGWLSGALLRKHVERMREKHDIIMKGANYDYTFDFSDISKEDRIGIGDFTFSVEDWKRLLDIVPKENIYWVDHHKRNYDKVYEAIPETQDIPGIRADHSAACRLIYTDTKLFNWYAGDNVVKMVNDWDTWKHEENETTLNFTAGLLLYTTDPATDEGYEFWHKCIFKYDAAFCKQVTEDGSKVRSVYESQYAIERKRGNTAHVEFKNEKYKLFVVNSTFGSSYAFGEEILNDHDACISWRYYPDSGLVKGDVRSVKKKAYPVAEACGGGGHPDASGFHMPLDDFIATFIKGTEEYKAKEKEKENTEKLKLANLRLENAKRLQKNAKIFLDEKTYKKHKDTIKSLCKLLVEKPNWIEVEGIRQNLISIFGAYGVKSKHIQKILHKWSKNSKHIEELVKIYDEDFDCCVDYDRKKHKKLNKYPEDYIVYFYRLSTFGINSFLQDSMKKVEKAAKEWAKNKKENE